MRIRAEDLRPKEVFVLNTLPPLGDLKFASDSSLEKSEFAGDAREKEIQTGLSLLADARAVRITRVQKKTAQNTGTRSSHFGSASLIRGLELSIVAKARRTSAAAVCPRTFALRRERKDL